MGEYSKIPTRYKAGDILVWRGDYTNRSVVVKAEFIQNGNGLGEKVWFISIDSKASSTNTRKKIPSAWAFQLAYEVEVKGSMCVETAMRLYV